MYKHRTTQAHVCVTESLAAAVQMFLNGIPVQVRSSLLPLSLLFIFRCGIFIFFNFLIPICNSDPGLINFFFLRGKACRKAWCCTWKRDFWQSHTPTSRNVLAHSWIFFCCSGTYGYVIPRVKRGLQSMCITMCCVSPVLTKVRVLIFLPFSFPLPLPLPSCNKSHIVAVFISTPSGVCLRLDSKPGTARLLPFWSPFLKVSGTSFVS